MEVLRHEHRVFVTNRSEPAVSIWQHYDQRAAIEPRISDPKGDFAADDFCLQEFSPLKRRCAAFRPVQLHEPVAALRRQAGANPKHGLRGRFRRERGARHRIAEATVKFHLLGEMWCRTRVGKSFT